MAPQVTAVIQTVEGVKEPQIERARGLSQISIEYARSKIAGYGLNFQDLNKTVSTAFAGGIAGAVFENERKFDLVILLDTPIAVC